MCNLYSNAMPVDAMRGLFDVAAEQEHLGNQPPLPAIHPRRVAPLVRMAGGGKRALVPMHRGLLVPQTP